MDVEERLKLEKALLHPVRLAIVLTLITRGDATIAELEKVLGIARQTIYTHLRKLMKASLVVKTIELSDRPRPRYRFNWRMAFTILGVLESIRDRVGLAIETLQQVLSEEQGDNEELRSDEKDVKEW